MHATMADEFLSTQDVVRWLSEVAPGTGLGTEQALRRAARRGEIPARRVRNRYVFSKRSLTEFLAGDLKPEVAR